MWEKVGSEMEFSTAYCYCSQESKWLKFDDLGRSGYVEVHKRKFEKETELINEKSFALDMKEKRHSLPQISYCNFYHTFYSRLKWLKLRRYGFVSNAWWYRLVVLL